MAEQTAVVSEAGSGHHPGRLEEGRVHAGRRTGDYGGISSNAGPPVQKTEKLI
jgi:hypothetical protein